jgi:exopolyphosphatase/pppGpp-phosphohydrolase
MAQGMSTKFLVLEFGSKSLKVHRQTPEGRFEKANVPWALGHEVYREGRTTRVTRERVQKVLRELTARGFRREGMLAIATGALRDAADREEFVTFLKEKQKLQVRVLSGREEASLLAQGFLQASQERPALVIDVGGGSLEMVYLEGDRTVLRDSLPLGAIRVHYLGAEREGWSFEQVAAYIEGVLREAPVVHLPVVHGTGGPLKAISRTLGAARIPLAAIRELEEQVVKEGPPAALSAERRAIFLPGVMVARRLLEHCRAESLHYLSIPIGRIFLERFLGRTQPELSDSRNAAMLQDLRLTRIDLPPGP